MRAIRTLQGMARVRSGQAPAWPLVSDRSVRRGSRVKRDFACTFTWHFSPVLVVLRSQSRLRLEGRTRILSGPSPDLSPARALPGCPRAGLPRWVINVHGRQVFHLVSGEAEMDKESPDLSHSADRDSHFLAAPHVPL